MSIMLYSPFPITKNVQNLPDLYRKHSLHARDSPIVETRAAPLENKYFSLTYITMDWSLTSTFQVRSNDVSLAAAGALVGIVDRQVAVIKFVCVCIIEIIGEVANQQ